MSSTYVPNTASTGSMSSTYTRVQAVPAVQKCKRLGVLRVSRVLNPEILEHWSKILRVINTPTSSASQYEILKYSRVLKVFAVLNAEILRCSK